jgi:DNA-binding GntR family transcriptional regulator
MLPPHKVTHRRQDAKSESVSTSIESESLSQDASRLSDRIAAGLREQILSGRLKPGSRIGQEALAAEFKVSRLPVRDALGRLESEGLIMLRPNSGAWVAKLDLRECIELYQIRERLEPLALSASVEHMPDSYINDLADIVETMANSRETEDFLRLDREFHLASYRYSGMARLNELVECYWNCTQHYRRAYTNLQPYDNHWIIHAEHRLMIDAFRRRDKEGAQHLLYEHIRRTRFELARHGYLFEDQPRAQNARKRRRPSNDSGASK